ncbi:hypothetical protein B0H13DRAFT_1865888 [Mycena leptocephala]|nr:hypothetical protein B0H13DRAFT_1865888 [Mycena leptocephala]
MQIEHKLRAKEPKSRPTMRLGNTLEPSQEKLEDGPDVSLMIFTNSKYIIRHACYWAGKNSQIGWSCPIGFAQSHPEPPGGYFGMHCPVAMPATTSSGGFTGG